MSTPINQHFVPKFYLKYFSQDGKTINVFDKALEKSFLASINSIASDKHFYESTTRESELESFYGNIEAAISPIFQSIINGLKAGSYKKINDVDRKALATFIWHQKTRSLEARIKMGHVANQIFSLATNTSKKDITDWLLKKAAPLKDFHLGFLNMTAINDKEPISKFENRTWVIFKNSTRVNFITSDHPVVSYRHEEINHRAFEIAMPLSPNYLVSFVEKNTLPEFDKFDGKILEFTDEQNVIFYNYLQTSQSTRQIFSMTSEFEFVRSVIKDDPSLKELNRKRFE